MKKITVFLILFSLTACLFSGCESERPKVVATTLPVYEFTSLLCEGTDISVGQIVTENVSCLHDYTLQVSHMRMIEAAELVVVSGAGLEEFLDDALTSANQVIDSSAGCHIHDGEHHAHHDDHTHRHETDPHIWLSPENAKIMVQNICTGLTDTYPQHADIFSANMAKITEQLDDLLTYGEAALATITTRELITFHDGFAYFAESFDLTILEAIEEESGSEASAQELKHLITLVNEHDLPAVFTEINGSASAASVISMETGAAVYPLSMVMSGSSYFEAMYQNIDTVKEALE